MRMFVLLVAVLLGLTTAPAANAAGTSMTRLQILARAAKWLTAYDGHQVPYSQTQYFEGYRQDCSGYVSMAAALPKPGPNTVQLFDSYTKPVAYRDMQAADLVIDKIGDEANGRHVVIFEKWYDPSKTSYWAYEQRGDYGTDHRVLSYGLNGGEYQPRRFNNF